MIRRWEVTGPGDTTAELLRILAMASGRHPILEDFNVVDRCNIHEKDRPAHRDAFRQTIREPGAPASRLTVWAGAAGPAQARGLLAGFHRIVEGAGITAPGAPAMLLLPESTELAAHPGQRQVRKTRPKCRERFAGELHRPVCAGIDEGQQRLREPREIP